MRLLSIVVLLNKHPERLLLVQLDPLANNKGELRDYKLSSRKSAKQTSQISRNKILLLVNLGDVGPLGLLHNDRNAIVILLANLLGLRLPVFCNFNKKFSRKISLHFLGREMGLKKGNKPNSCCCLNDFPDAIAFVTKWGTA